MPADGESFYEARKQEVEAEGHAVPFDPNELVAAAEAALAPAVFEELQASPGTDRANRAGFGRWEIVPRVFRDVSGRDLGVELFGESVPAPLGIAPIGRQALYHPEGELASARAAARLGLPFTLSTVASRSIEAVAEVGGEAPRLFQVYWTEDEALLASLLSRAEAAGYSAVLLTVDFQAPRWLPQGFGRDVGPSDRAPFANVATDPVAAERGIPADDYGIVDRTASWADLDRLADVTDLPVYVKGISHPADAERAVEAGADGIVVSNHGGRQLDGGAGTITMLPRVADAVDGRRPVLFDGGIRTGADAFTALALGADGVFVGRPAVYGLSVAGERGVYEVLHNLLAELDTILGQAGYTGFDAVDRAALRERDG